MVQLCMCVHCTFPHRVAASWLREFAHVYTAVGSSTLLMVVHDDVGKSISNEEKKGEEEGWVTRDRQLCSRGARIYDSVACKLTGDLKANPAYI